MYENFFFLLKIHTLSNILKDYKSVLHPLLGCTSQQHRREPQPSQPNSDLNPNHKPTPYSYSKSKPQPQPQPKSKP